MRNDSPSPEKECLKITNFKYRDGKSPKFKKPQSGNKNDHIPIRTLVQKMSSNPQLYKDTLKAKTSFLMSRSDQNFTHKIKSEKNLQSFLTPRDSQYIPKPQMFNRYNYENYNGYEYKNPFRPPKYPIEDKVIANPKKKQLKVNPTHGTDKNLQIVFCEHKYHDFVRRTNEEVNRQYQESKKRKTIDGRTRRQDSRGSSKLRVRSNSMMLNQLKKSLTLGKRKSSLSNYLQEFNTLEKLSNYMEREHKLNEKYLFNSANDSSRTVLLDIVIHRFEFLKSMKKKARDLVFEILLGFEEITNFYKINIHEYIKFNQLFVSRDAEPSKVAMFIFVFLFKVSQETTVSSVKKSMSLLEGSAKLHEFVEDQLIEIVKECEENSKKVYNKIFADAILQKAFIDLLLEHRK